MTKVELTLDDILAGKATRIKNNDYFPTMAYVEPFLERMSKLTTDFRVQAKLPSQVTYTRSGELNTEDITFNRVLIQAVLPNEYQFDNHQQVIGMVYGLDVTKPVVKFYNGGLNMACTNLCVFNPNLLSLQGIESSTPVDYKPLDRIIGETDDLHKWLTKLSNTPFTCSERNMNEQLGKWIRGCMKFTYDHGFGKVKLATSTPIKAYEYLFVDKSSPYYVGEATETSMFNIYNAFTQILTDNRDKDVLSEFEKCLLLKDILDLEC